ncbi:BTAD domain-containing putative transcriptional regulator [Streptomyces spectabilis]|uniref:Bacterial transcriptional activator domain-containing protein n=1 Tax=Streptomyces spectabilis TaxID=68270 RepID=A0A516RIR7_STRST|nr:BTAD domain-containing putative transcriptional regulator [Streptomyces spectabilis]QDQ15556.1 hypothetical protein FH965_37535 [Streptomyces spectabilis]
MGSPARVYDSGSGAREADGAAGAGTGPLHLYLLGGFRAERPHGVPPAARWPRPGARTLVKLLALAPGHQLHREHVMACCWPHAELGAALRNLRVALHTARHALEPELRPRAVSSYVVTDGTLLRLVPGAVLVDADRVESLAENALSQGGVPELAAAFAAFTGELLPEDRYAAWADARRTHLADLRATTGCALAGRHLADGDPARAAAVARRVLEQAPGDERARHLLMDASRHQGPHRKHTPPPDAREDAGREDTGLEAARVRLDWALTLDRAGRYDEAIDVLRQALAAYAPRGHGDARALAAARLAEVLARRHRPAEAHASLRAHAPGPAAPAEVGAAHHMARSMVLFYEGAYEAGLAAARTAEATLRTPPPSASASRAVPSPHSALLARALAQQAVCNGLLGRFDQATAPAEQALSAAEASGDPALLANALSVLRENARRAGDLAQALRHGRRALTLAEQAGRPTATAFERANLAELHLSLGESAEAERLARAAAELAEPFGGTVLAFALTALARVRTAADPDGAAALLDRAEHCAREGGHRQALDEVRAARAEWAAHGRSHH